MGARVVGGGAARAAFAAPSRCVLRVPAQLNLGAGLISLNDSMLENLNLGAFHAGVELDGVECVERAPRARFAPVVSGGFETSPSAQCERSAIAMRAVCFRFPRPPRVNGTRTRTGG